MRLRRWAVFCRGRECTSYPNFAEHHVLFGSEEAAKKCQDENGWKGDYCLDCYEHLEWVKRENKELLEKK